MKNIYILLLLSFLTFFSQAQPFITTWSTSNGTITIPTSYNLYSYNYTVSYRTKPNGTITILNNQTSDCIITGLLPNIDYEITISGVFPAISFFNSSYGYHLKSIDQWGSNSWVTMSGAFEYCENLVMNAIDIPNLTNVSNMNNMFQYCKNFNGKIGNWNTSSVTNMIGMFRFASSFNQPINNWNTINVTKMGGMFESATSFNQNLNNWKTINVTDMSSMFANANSFNQNLGIWNIQKVTSLNDILYQSGLNTTNYDSTLIGWYNQNVKRNLNLYSNGMSYCNGIASRTSLISSKGWTISGDQYNCSITTLLNENTTPQTPKIYPNPNNGNFIINLDQISGNSDLKMFNTTGQVVWQEKLSQTQNTINTNLSKGLYLVIISNNGKKTRQKLVVE